MSEWRENHGRMPGLAAGKRIVVELRNGSICGEQPVGSGSPAGWPADGKGGCRWSLEGSDFDIVRYRIL
jgi:hypothetical protein